VEKDGQIFALKVYKNLNERTFQKNSAYIEGKFYISRAQAKAVKAKNTFGKQLMQNNWIKREFYMLRKIFEL